MNKLITKNPVLRFKEGKKIEKFLLGGNPKPGTVILLAGKFYTRRNDGQWVDKDGKRYVSGLHKNVGVTEFRPFKDKVYIETSSGFKGYEYTDASGRKVREPINTPKVTRTSNGSLSTRKLSQPVKKSVRVSKSAVTTSNKPNRALGLVNAAIKTFNGLPGAVQLFPGLRMPIDVYKASQGEESNWSLLKPIAPYFFHEVSPNTNQKITNKGDLNIISSNTPDWLLRRMGPSTQRTATPTTIVELPVLETETTTTVSPVTTVSPTTTTTSSTTASPLTSSSNVTRNKSLKSRNSRRSYRTKVQPNVTMTPPSYNIEDLSKLIIPPTFENVATTIETPNIIAPTATYNRRDTRQFLRDMGFNPYNFTGDLRRALRMVINGVADDYDRNLVLQMGL